MLSGLLNLYSRIAMHVCSFIISSHDILIASLWQHPQPAVWNPFFIDSFASSASSTSHLTLNSADPHAWYRIVRVFRWTIFFFANFVVDLISTTIKFTNFHIDTYIPSAWATSAKILSTNFHYWTHPQKNCPTKISRYTVAFLKYRDMCTCVDTPW